MENPSIVLWIPIIILTVISVIKLTRKNLNIGLNYNYNDTYDGAVFQKDFTDLLEYDNMADKLTQEQLEISKDDYEVKKKSILKEL